MLVAMCFGLPPSWGMLAVPFIACVAGFGWAGFGIAIASRMDSFENFSYIISAVLTPLFLVAGTFFPIDQLPAFLQAVAWLTPLYHGVALSRGLSLGYASEEPLVMVLHAAVLVAFAAFGAYAATRTFRQQLVRG